MADDKIQAPERPLEADRKAADDLASLLRQAQKGDALQRPTLSGETKFAEQVVSHVEKDAQGIKSLVTTDGRTFERSDGMFKVTVPGMKEPVLVRELTVSGDIISYKIGHFCATESTGGRRSVVDLDDKSGKPELAPAPRSVPDAAEVVRRAKFLSDINLMAEGKITEPARVKEIILRTSGANWKLVITQSLSAARGFWAGQRSQLNYPKMTSTEILSLK